MQPYQTLRQWRRWFELGVSLSLLGLVVVWVDFNQFVQVFRTINIWYLLPFFVVIYLDRALMAYKWSLLLRAIHIRVRFLVLFRAYLIAPLIGALLPATVGADLFRAYDIKRHNVDIEPVLASVVVERLIGCVAMLLFATLSLSLGVYGLSDIGPHLDTIVWGLTGGLLAVLILLAGAAQPVRAVVEAVATRFAWLPGVTQLSHTHQLYTAYRQHRRVLGLFFAWTCVEQFAPVLGMYILVNALQINVSALALVCIVPLILLCARLPISVDGLGVAEGMSVVLFGLIGVSATDALALAVSFRLATHLPSLPWAVQYLFENRRARLMPQPDTPPLSQTAS